MQYIRELIAFGGIVFRAMSSAFGDPKIDEKVIGSAGHWAGYAISPHGVHVAMLNSKGSRFIVSVDGVDGPHIDQLIGPDGKPFTAGNSNSGRSGGIIQVPIIFSDDGLHSAYLAKTDDDYILMLDNKEVVRAKFTGAALSYGPLTFTAGGKHLYYGEANPAGGGYHIIMDGKPGPNSHTPPKVVTSPDGVHYAYVGTQADGMDTPWAVVDGKQVKFFGNDLQFTAKGHLVALLKGKGEMALNIDGKNVIVGAALSQIHISPGGDELAVMVYDAKAGKNIFTINGKPVPGSDGALVQNVYFSPDDKHYAVQCSSGGVGAYMIIDGKKGEKYDAINGGINSINMSSTARAWALGHSPAGQILLDQAAVGIPGFTADSANFLYVAQVGLKSFFVTNDDESDAYQAIAPVVTPDGKHIAFLAGNGPKPVVVIDGKTVALNGAGGGAPDSTTGLAFTPDGQHWVFTNHGVIFVDGVEQKGVTFVGQYAYSPDSRHLLVMGTAAGDRSRYGLFLDGKLVTTGPGISNASHPTFTPDSKHVFWVGHRAAETSTDYDSGVLYVDGKPTAVHFIESDPTQPGNWQVSADGVLTFIARSGDDLKRFDVTPGADTSLATMLANTPDAGPKK